MNGIHLKDILEKREEILNKNSEYIDIPDDDQDDVSYENIYSQKKELMKYNFGKNMYELTEVIKMYLRKERTRKFHWAMGSYLCGFIGVSGLIVLNDYILLNYFV